MGEGMQSLWTDLAYYYPDRHEMIEFVQNKYRRKNKCRDTLVFEPVGSFFQLLDPEKDQFDLGEPSMKEFKCLIGNQICVALMRIWPLQLLHELARLHKYYELVVYTILPRGIMD